MEWRLAAEQSARLQANGSLWHDLRHRARDFVKLPAVPALEKLVHAMMDAMPAARPMSGRLLEQPEITAGVPKSDAVRIRFARNLSLMFAASPAGGACGHPIASAFDAGRLSARRARLRAQALLAAARPRQYRSSLAAPEGGRPAPMCPPPAQ